MRQRMAGRVAAGAFAGFLVVYLALHAASWSAGWPKHASSYADTQWAWMWNTGLALIGIGAFALVVAFHGRRSTGTELARALILAAGILAIVLIIFPTQRGLDDRPNSVQGQLHDLGATSAVAVLVTAMYLLAAAGRIDAWWQRVAGSSFLWPHVIMALGMTWLVLDRVQLPQGGGLVQRALVFLTVVWLLGVSLRVSRLPIAGMPADGPTVRPETADVD